MDIILELGGNAARLYKVLELASEYPEDGISALPCLLSVLCR